MKTLRNNNNEVDSGEYLTVDDPEFKPFYDDYFKNWTFDDKGILLIDQHIPLPYPAFVFWILTTDHINGFRCDNSDKFIECNIFGNTIRFHGISLKTFEVFAEFKIDPYEPLNQQYLSILNLVFNSKGGYRGLYVDDSSVYLTNHINISWRNMAAYMSIPFISNYKITDTDLMNDVNELISKYYSNK